MSMKQTVKLGVRSRKEWKKIPENQKNWKVKKKSEFQTADGGLAAAVAAPLPSAPAAISDSLISIGMRSSYKVGACRIMAAVPSRTAVVKIHKKSRSRTMATYFQSSRT